MRRNMLMLNGIQSMDQRVNPDQNDKVKRRLTDTMGEAGDNLPWRFGSNRYNKLDVMMPVKNQPI